MACEFYQPSRPRARLTPSRRREGTRRANLDSESEEGVYGESEEGVIGCRSRGPGVRIQGLARDPCPARRAAA
eukprot:3934065-Rhodomonas_salina.1